MAITDKHPLYAAGLPDWELMEHAYAGERTVKNQGVTYLSPTSSMYLDGMNKPTDLGWKAYQAYKGRAVFHDFVKDAVLYFIGLLHSKPAAIELPESMEPLLTNATVHGESLQMLLRRINEAQLVTGRVGLLADMPQGETIRAILPYIATYHARSIVNWDEGSAQQVQEKTLNMVVLDESGPVRKDRFSWDTVQKYRVLVLGELTDNETIGTYRQQLVDSTGQFDEASAIEPSFRGNKLEEIPFVFCNSKDTAPDPDAPPLLGLANLAMAIYRGEADYRQNLFMTGQDTLVVINGKHKDGEPLRTGAGARIDVNKDGDAKYIGVSGEGLSEQREALQNDKLAAGNKAGQLVDTTSADKESGDSLNTRLAAQAATLNQIAVTGAAALEKMLKIIARWTNADPEKVKVTPNLEWTATQFKPSDLKELQTAKTMGLPIARESIHAIMVDKGYTQLSYDDEIALLEDEEPIIGGLGTPFGGNPEDDPAAPPAKAPAGKKPAAKEKTSAKPKKQPLKRLRPA